MLDSLMSIRVESGLSCLFVCACVERQDLSPGCWGGGIGWAELGGGIRAPMPATGTDSSGQAGFWGGGWVVMGGRGRVWGTMVGMWGCYVGVCAPRD